MTTPTLRAALAAPEPVDPVPVVGYLLRSGHGDHFARRLKSEYLALEHGGHKMWQPVCLVPDHLAAIAAKDAEIAALKADAEWRPIETAPEDGEFLVYMPGEYTKFQVARFRPNAKVIGNVFAFDLTKPTHWKPLPPSPIDKESKT